MWRDSNMANVLSDSFFVYTVNRVVRELIHTLSEVVPWGVLEGRGDDDDVFDVFGFGTFG